MLKGVGMASSWEGKGKRAKTRKMPNSMSLEEEFFQFISDTLEQSCLHFSDEHFDKKLRKLYF